MFFIMLSEVSFSQSYKSTSRKAIKNFEKARRKYLCDNRKALMYADKALQYDENYLDALLLKAELYQDMWYDSLALMSYERIFEIDSMAYPKSAISLSKLYMKYFCYDKSVVAYICWCVCILLFPCMGAVNFEYRSSLWEEVFQEIKNNEQK
jgi:hypothetical protein